MKRTIIVLILVLAVFCKGDIFTSHLQPNADSSLDIGTNALLWRYVYSDSFTDGTALWEESSLSDFISISGTTLTDGIFIVSEGVISAGTWQGSTITVPYGGTGATSLTDGGILVGSGTDAITALAVASNGQIPIGDGSGDPVLATITGGSGIDVTNAAASITLDLGELTEDWVISTYDINLVAGELVLGGLTASRLVAMGADSNLISTDIYGWIAGTTNQINRADDGDGTMTLSLPQTITFGDSTVTIETPGAAGNTAGITVQTGNSGGNAGDIQLQGGSGGTGEGGDVALLGGTGTFDGGDVRITGGAGSTSVGTITLTSSNQIYLNGPTRIQSLSGLLKGTTGVVSAATAGTDYQSGSLTAGRVPYATGSPATLTDTEDLHWSGNSLEVTGAIDLSGVLEADEIDINDANMAKLTVDNVQIDGTIISSLNANNLVLNAASGELIGGAGDNLSISGNVGAVNINASTNLTASGDADISGDLYADEFYLKAPTSTDYLFSNRGARPFTIRSTEAGGGASQEFFTNDGDGTDWMYFRLIPKGTVASVTNSEQLVFDYIPGNREFRIYTVATGSGTLLPLEILTTGNANQIYLDPNGAIQMDTLTTFGAGGATALYVHSGGTIGTVVSARRFKTNIRPVAPDDSGRIHNLNCIKFDDANGPDRNMFGLIAEEVDEVMPEMVIRRREKMFETITEPNGVSHEDFKGWKTTDEPYGVHYDRLIIPLLKEVQLLRAEVNDLKTRVSKREK